MGNNKQFLIFWLLYKNKSHNFPWKFRWIQNYPYMYIPMDALNIRLSWVCGKVSLDSKSKKKKKRKKSNAIITDNDTIFTNTLSLIITRHTQRVGIKLCQFLWQKNYKKKKKKKKKKKGRRRVVVQIISL